MVFSPRRQLKLCQKNYYLFLINKTKTKHTKFSGLGEPHIDFASIVAPWYTGPVWQKMPLFPWMDQKTLRLSDVYTKMEMETYSGRYKNKTVIPLNHYKDLFKDIKPNGTRILVKGDPGVGKTTFVQKVAFDWATKQLVQFDVVLVVKLKFTDKTQSIASMVKNQIETLWENDRISEADVAGYMKSGRDRVLLVLDGLDEINLKQYSQVQEVLLGERYRKCCILATTRPHVAETLYNKMTNIAKIKGFSREQAKQFVGNILDEEELVQFLGQLEKRKMSQMHQVPLIVQALALMFRQYEQLPRTYTITYDELVFFLRKSCKQSKDLTEDELQAAMNEVNELAFKGLIREDKKLVFSRDEIKDDNVRKLGILTAEKAGSGFKPTEVLQFAHLTIQEHSASDHVVKRLLSDDRGPWEALIEQFHKDASTKDQELPEIQRRKFTTTHPIPEETDELGRKNMIVKSALQKLLTEALSRPDIEKEFRYFLHKLVEAGVYDEEIDFTRIYQVFTSYPGADKVLTEEEQRVLAHYLLRELLMETPKEWRAHEKSWLKMLLRKTKEKQNPTLLKNYILDQKEMYQWLASNPEMGKQILIQVANFHKIHHSHPELLKESQFNMPYQYIAQEFSQLLERVEYDKTLFRFIIGKLANNPAVRDVILQEMASLVIQHSFDPDTGGILPITEMVRYISDLKSESLPQDENGNLTESDPYLVTPVLVHLISTMKYSNAENLEPDTPCALKVLGGGEDFIISEFTQKVITHIKHLRNIHIVEMGGILPLNQDQHLLMIYKDFTMVLYQSPHIVSMELRDIDPKLTGILTQNLPLSVQRFSVSVHEDIHSHPRGTLAFPSEVHLVCLQLHNCLSRVGDLFRNTNFPSLKKISIKNDGDGWEVSQPLIWSKEDAQSLLDAVRTGRMPDLAELNIRDCCLRGCGPEFVEILKSESFCMAKFPGAKLTIEDGKIILKNIREGNLDHIELLNLLDDGEISLLKKDFERACEQREITLEMNSSPSDIGLLKYDYIKELAGKDVALVVTRLQSTFTTEQAQTLKSLFSSLTTQQTHSMMTLFFSFTPKQKQSIKTLLSSFTAEQAQTLFANFFQNKSRVQVESSENMEVNAVPGDTGNDVASPLTTLVYGVIQEHIGKDAAVVVARIVSRLNQDQTLNMMTLFSSLTPEQVRSRKTLISSITQEQNQTMKTLISTLTLEQTDIVMTSFTKTNQNQSAGEQLETWRNEAPQSQCASSAPGTGNSASQDQMAFAQTIPNLVPDFFENRSRSTVQLKTPSKEATEPEFKFSSIHVPAFCPRDNSSNQDEKQPSSKVQPQTPSREAPQSLFDFSSIRNRVHTFFDTDKSANRDQPLETTENSQRGSDARQLQFDFSWVRNRVHTFCNTDNSAKQDEPQESTENSQCRSDVPQTQYDFSRVRNLVHTFFDTDNSANQNEPKDKNEDSQQNGGEQRQDDYLDDIDLD